MPRKILALIIAGLISSCAPIPTSGTLEWARASQVSVEPLQNAQTVAVIIRSETKRYKEIRQCVSNAVGEVIGKGKVFGSDQENKAFHPLIVARWNLSLEEDNALRGALDEPQVVQHARKRGVKYIVVLEEIETKEEGDVSYVLVGWIRDARTYAKLSSQVIDIEMRQEVSTISVEASASTSGFFTLIGVYSIIPLPRHEDEACRELGTRLGKAFLSGKVKTYERPQEKPEAPDSDDENAGY